MKTLIVVVLALFAEVLAKGAIGSIPIGSTNAVETYDITNSDYASTTIRWTQTNDNTRIQWKTRDVSFTSKQQMLDVNQQILADDIQLSVGNDPIADKTKPVFVSVIYGMIRCPYWSMSTGSTNFSYIDTGEGYQVPDLSWIIPKMGYPIIPISIKDLKWGRVEVRLASDLGHLYYVTDSRTYTNGPTVFNTTAVELDSTFYSGCLSIGIPFATSGNSGPYRLKVYLVSGTNNTFEIFDGNGVKQQETPFIITNFAAYEAYVSMDVLGGDLGRVFTLEKSTDMLNWLPCTGTNVVSSEQKSHLTLTKGLESKVFYRVKAINASPASFPTPQQRIENFKVSINITFDVIGGDIGNRFVIEKSTNLINWVAYPQVNTNSNNAIPISIPKGSETEVFFRTRSF